MTASDDPAPLIAELRARVEAATAETDELVAELTERRAVNDELESLVDVLLGLGESAVIVVDDERRIRAVSRAAAERFDAAAVGKPLSSALPGDIYDGLSARLDGDGSGTHPGAEIHPLPGGGAVVVLVTR
jgi:PAS domain-containing protein